MDGEGQGSDLWGNDNVIAGDNRHRATIKRPMGLPDASVDRLKQTVSAIMWELQGHSRILRKVPKTLQQSPSMLTVNTDFGSVNIDAEHGLAEPGTVIPISGGGGFRGTRRLHI
jgi:hypothetical protein